MVLLTSEGARWVVLDSRSLDILEFSHVISQFFFPSWSVLILKVCAENNGLTDGEYLFNTDRGTLCE